MSCGHCRLKITSALESNGYKIASINMDEQTILLDEPIKAFKSIKGCLEQIGYIVSIDQTYLSFKEIVFWNPLLEEENAFSRTLEFVNDKGYTLIEFSDSPFGLKILADDSFVDELTHFVNNL
jgi:copper chaperone CopZ